MINRETIFRSLERLRKGLLQIILTFVLLGIAIFPFSKTLLRQLYETNLRVDLVAEPNSKVSLVAFAIPEAFLSLLKLTLYASLFLSIPIIFYQIWKSFAPLFRLKELKSTLPILLTSLALFYLGASFCYFVTLPFGVKFLIGYQSVHIKPMISVGKYVSFCAVFIFGFGLTFELPLILALLSYIRVVNAAFLSRNRKYAILLIAIVAAVVTPTPDVFNMALMGVPLYILFEIGVILVKIIERKRAGAEAPPTKKVSI
ncbi:MAG: twin-arginine translocase subunit TatC [Thermodesulfobacteriota bacterium]|jgi:sec-independent protein translocase protein TatC